MPITKDNVTISDWDNAQKLYCPYLRSIGGVWIALNENPCGKHPEDPICRGCAESSKDKVIVIEEKQ